MLKYIIKRLLLMLPTLLGIIFVIIVFLNYMPGTNQNSFSSAGEGDTLDAIFERFDIKNTLFAKYLRYCYNLAIKHEFGPAGRGSANIGADLANRLKFTLILTGLGFLATFIIGIPLGIYSALYHNKFQDQLISSVSLIFSSVPSYCLTLFLVLFFSLWLKLLPVSGINKPGAFVMPTMVLAVGGIALTVRMTRSAVIEVMDQQYITALKAKGLKNREIIYKHIFKNSLIPVVSTLNNLTAQMLCSTLVVENFFSIPGLGAYLITAVSHRNLYSILGCVVIISVLLMLFSIISDVLCMLVNPKMKTQYSRKERVSGGDSVEA